MCEFMAYICIYLWHNACFATILTQPSCKNHDYNQPDKHFFKAFNPCLKTIRLQHFPYNNLSTSQNYVYTHPTMPKLHLKAKKRIMNPLFRSHSPQKGS